MKIRLAVAGVSAALLVLPSPALANGAVSVDWHVIGAGGDHYEGSDYTLDCTIGQAVVGTTDQSPLELCAGFWCGLTSDYGVFLPLVFRG